MLQGGNATTHRDRLRAGGPAGMERLHVFTYRPTETVAVHFEIIPHLLFAPKHNRDKYAHHWNLKMRSWYHPLRYSCWNAVLAVNKRPQPASPFVGISSIHGKYKLSLSSAVGSRSKQPSTAD
jgi:hypothetical protein